MKVIERTVEIPKEITVEVEGSKVSLKAGNKENLRTFKAKGFEFEKKGNSVIIRKKNAKKRSEALMNCLATHLSNMALGLKQGFEYRLEIVYSHFPLNVTVKGSEAMVSNLGGSKQTKKTKIIGDTTVQVKGKEIIVKGINKEHTAQTAANLEQITRIRNKDCRIFQDGIYIVEKDKSVSVKEKSEKKGEKSG